MGSYADYDRPTRRSHKYDKYEKQQPPPYSGKRFHQNPEPQEPWRPTPPHYNKREQRYNEELEYSSSNYSSKYQTKKYEKPPRYLAGGEVPSKDYQYLERDEMPSRSKRYPPGHNYNDELQTPNTKSLPYYPEKQWPTQQSQKPYQKKVFPRSRKTYGIGNQLNVNPDSLFKFTCSPFEAAQLPSPNLMIATPTDADHEKVYEQTVAEERLSPTRQSSDESPREFEAVKICSESKLLNEIDLDFE